MKPSNMDMVYRYVDSHKDDFVQGLKPLLAQPTISAQGVGITETAELVKKIMEDLGVETRLIETPGAPVIYGEILRGKDAPTVLIYGHYDVQPPEPLEAWKSPPFQPTIRDERIYCRGAADNKGQLYAQLMGVKAHLQVNGHVPINVKFIFEGEEESGSTHLEQFVREHEELLKTNLVYSSDGPVHESGRPAIVMGVRGILYVELTTKGPNKDLHSGNWGGPIPNPAWRIVDLLSTMKENKTGKILIKGFYDKVRPPTQEERQALRSIPLNRKKIADELGLDEKRLPKAEEFYERLMFRPTLNICGFSSGYTGRGMKTVLPSTATVKMDMRLVSSQDPDDIFAKFCKHVKRFAPEVEVRKLGQMRPSRTPLSNRYVRPIIEAVREGTGQNPVVFPSLGGSMPDYVFTGVLGVPSIMVPYANFDESNHAPNENFAIEYFMKGIKCCASVLSHLS